jgi:hypothetical protein
MTAHLKSINREVWKVNETKFEVANPEAPTPVEEKKLQCNGIAISALHKALDDKTIRLAQTMHLSCINTSAVFEWKEVRFYMTHIT